MTFAPPAGSAHRSGAGLVQTRCAPSVPVGVLGDRLPKAGATPRLPFAFTLGSHRRRPVKKTWQATCPLGHALGLHQRLLRPLAICAVRMHQRTWLRPLRRPLTRLRRLLRFRPGLGEAGNPHSPLIGPRPPNGVAKCAIHPRSYARQSVSSPARAHSRG